MIIIMGDINKQTYIPGAWAASLCLLFYKRKHPKTLGYVSAYVRQISVIFLQHAPHIPHLCFCFFFIFLHFLFCWNTQQYS